MTLDHAQLVQALIADRARLLAYILSIVRDEHAAEDVYQEVCTLALEKRDEINDADHLAAWVRLTARHRALKAVEKGARRPMVLDAKMLDLLEQHWQSLEAVESSEMVDALRTCMRELTPHAQQLVRMRYAEGIRSSVIAQQLNRQLNAVYVAMTRIHRQLAECIRHRMGIAERGGES
ncbi:MAG: sigma-70 family RNA polymerase sigma factor [Planctomycetes bacterium]|nr:sigma-70 family RNA polymerase sigma factor [Planctomycetota bacterium]